MQKKSSMILAKANNVIYSLNSTSMTIRNKRKELLEKNNKNVKLQTLLPKVKELLLQVLYIKKRELLYLTDIVNKGLAYTYPDRELEFRIEFVNKFNKIVPEFYLNDLLLKQPFVGDGGGIISIISLLLYVSMIKIKNINTILMDEVEAMVDISASKKLFMFLNKFAELNDLCIVNITHKNLDEYKSLFVTDRIQLLKVPEVVS